MNSLKRASGKRLQASKGQTSMLARLTCVTSRPVCFIVGDGAGLLENCHDVTAGVAKPAMPK